MKLSPLIRHYMLTNNQTKRAKWLFEKGYYSTLSLKLSKYKWVNFFYLEGIYERKSLPCHLGLKLAPNLTWQMV